MLATVAWRCYAGITMLPLMLNLEQISLSFLWLYCAPEMTSKLLRKYSQLFLHGYELFPLAFKSGHYLSFIFAAFVVTCSCFNHCGLQFTAWSSISFMLMEMPERCYMIFSGIVVNATVLGQYWHGFGF